MGGSFVPNTGVYLKSFHFNWAYFLRFFRLFAPAQKLSARAFDGLNNLRKLNLENNRLKRLERGIFTGVPAVLNLNLNANQLETITYNNFLPLMDNLVNSTAMKLILRTTKD